MFAGRAGLALGLVLAAGAYATERFRIGIDDQVRGCLPPHRFFLIDRHARRIGPGQLVAFRAHAGMGPYFRAGQIVIKRAAGGPGDRIRVSARTVRVNDTVTGRGLALAATLGRAPADFVRTLTLPAGHLWVMGDTADSFDSRYWGPLPASRVIGRAYALR